MSAETDVTTQLVETTAATSLDVAMDAIVYEVHPAFLRRQAATIAYDADYPYGSPPAAALPPANCELPRILGVATDAAAWLVRTTDSYFAALQSPPDFVVPKTFGMSAILGIMTALALMFACLRWLNAPPAFYFFFSIEAIAICLAQMFYGQAPRLASIVTGAIILPVFTIVAATMSDQASPLAICLAIGFVPCGAVLGYLTGTCAAGIFLVMDYLEPYLQHHAFSSLTRSRPSP